eukprot:TRINITY_DN8592_c0_g1_i1.p1 TRINITY_DN8592_c0_g1~~TRINITY_DN8592_c0_g1_i1.p1  ORF type:complete len:182 (+),score=26.08 TRINITY_DN8592_c0_g1_i1:134-679(+)
MATEGGLCSCSAGCGGDDCQECIYHKRSVETTCPIDDIKNTNYLISLKTASLNSNLLEIVFEAPIVTNLLFVVAKFEQSSSSSFCRMPGSLWQKTIQSETCTEEWTLHTQLNDLVQQCLTSSSVEKSEGIIRFSAIEIDTSTREKIQSLDFTFSIVVKSDNYCNMALPLASPDACVTIREL